MQDHGGVRFLSAEPLLGPLSINWRGIHWCIIGGESGVHLYDQKVREQRALVDYASGKWSPRPDRAVWVRDLIRECKEAGLAVFFKQRLVRRGMWEPIYVPAASASTVSARVRRT